MQRCGWCGEPGISGQVCYYFAMVSVHTSHALPIGGDQPDFPSWLESLGIEFGPQERETLLHACEFAQGLYAEDPDAMSHVLGTAAILAHQNLDQESIVAAILQGATEHGPDGLAKVAAIFGDGVARLVDGVARMGQISEYTAPAGGDKREQGAHIESLRKMLLAMVEDIRVVLIKLAERTQTMRELARCRRRHAPPHRARDAGYFCAAGEPSRRVAGEMGTGRPVVPLSGARSVQENRQAAGREAPRPRAIYRGRARAVAAGTAARTASRPK